MGIVKGFFSVLFGLLALLGGLAVSTAMLGGAVYGAFEVVHFNTELLPAIGWGIGFALIQWFIGTVVAYFSALMLTIINWK